MSSTNALAPAGLGAACGTGQAYAKAILLGEHAVVYGAPALAMPVPQLTVTATATRPQSGTPSADAGGDEISFVIAAPGTRTAEPLSSAGLRHLVAAFKQRTGIAEPLYADVLIDSAIPQGRGLGSSAACARAAVLALADAFGCALDAATVFDLVQASETIVHGRASGIDAVTTGAASPVHFRAGRVRPLPVAMGKDAEGGPLIVIADSGVGSSTKDAVEMLREKFDDDPSLREAFVRRVSSLTDEAVNDLAAGRLDGFGARLTENHRLLREVGISTDLIDGLVEAALAVGGLGAKISGGGLGGCMLAVAADADRADAVVQRLHAAGAEQTWVVALGRYGRHGD